MSNPFDAAVEAHAARGVTDPCTDLANADRLVGWFGADLRHVTTWGKDLTWTGQRWHADEAAARRLAAETARRHLADALDYHRAAVEELAQARANEEPEEGPTKRTKRAQAVIRWAVTSQGAPRLAAMLSLARTAPSVAVAHELLDADPWALNVANGTIDLRTGELRPHQRQDLITKLAPVEYDPAATAPTWDAFLRRAMAGDETLVSFLRRLVGYALTGSTREHVLAFHYGNGANGKSTFFGAVHAMLGDYARPGPRNLLFASKVQQHPTELAALFGARFVTCSEVEEGRAFDESKLKDLTGGDPIPARRMHEDFWTFAPTHKLFVAGNHKPIVKGTDDGIWRRLRLVPWTVQIPPEERDRELGEKLRAELPGILAWAVRGCLEWQRDGLGEPIAVRDATDVYREESDPAAEFFALRCVFEPEGRVTRKMLRAQYEAWAEENGARPMDAKKLAAALRIRGVEHVSMRHEGRVADGWRGVRLATDAERERMAVGRRVHVGGESDHFSHSDLSRDRSNLDPITTSPYAPTEVREPDEDELEERRAIQAEACGSEAAQ